MLMLIVLVGGLSFVVCFPWMFWSISLFGTPFQISSSAIMLHNYANVPKDVFEAVKWYLGRISWFIPRYLYKLILFNFTAVVGLAIFYFPGFRLKLKLLFLESIVLSVCNNQRYFCLLQHDTAPSAALVF